MVSKKKITISWSGGKDSAFALYKILTSGDYEVVHLHTVFNSETRRVGLHGVHEDLIERQARSLSIPLKKLFLPESNDNRAYEQVMKTFYRECYLDGVEGVVFGDIFLEDLKQYRETLMKATHLKGIYPLWKIESQKLMDDFLNVGFRTVICSANASHLEEKNIGSTIDQQFLSSLKDGVDPCGENGEFHTFVYDGPIFKEPIPFSLGEKLKRSYYFKTAEGDQREAVYWFQDLL